MTTTSNIPPLTRIADHLVTLLADDPEVTDAQLDAAVHHLYGVDEATA